jgi:hypothetical protein
LVVGRNAAAQLEVPSIGLGFAADYRGFDPRRSRVNRGVYEGSCYTTLANLYDISRSQIEERERKRRAQWRRLIQHPHDTQPVPLFITKFRLCFIKAHAAMLL